MYTLNFTLLVFWDHWTESLTIRTVADNDMSFDYNGVLCVCHQEGHRFGHDTSCTSKGSTVNLRLTLQI